MRSVLSKIEDRASLVVQFTTNLQSIAAGNSSFSGSGGASYFTSILSKSVSSGAFSATLRSVATSLLPTGQLSALSNASATSVTVAIVTLNTTRPTRIPTSAPTSKWEVYSSTVYTFGPIVIFLIAIISYGVRYLRKYRESKVHIGDGNTDEIELFKAESDSGNVWNRLKPELVDNNRVIERQKCAKEALIRKLAEARNTGEAIEVPFEPLVR
jgi:hypothetical protein